MTALFGAGMAAQAQPRWAVDPKDVGGNLPPSGQSLFDTLVAGHEGRAQVPFPFEKLVALIERRGRCNAQAPCTRAVLIPLGRSLQRTAAAPDYFKYPRVVVAVTGESGREGALHLKDRLYLGYQEKTDLIEVISYNELAGRFEFQLVKDYRAGGQPKVFYGNRLLCMACHQNQAPLFSRQVWDETNANPRIAAALLAFGDRFHGIAVRRGVDIPNSIDESVARANLLAVTRLIWTEGCGASDRCRRTLVLAALQFGLTQGRGFDEAARDFAQLVAGNFLRNAAQQWPEGLAVPDPGIPNRDPLPGLGNAPGLALAHVPAPLEPLRPRTGRTLWLPRDPALPRQGVANLAQWFSGEDLSWLRRELAAQTGVTRRAEKARCAVARARRSVRLRCDAAMLSFAATLGRDAARLDWITTPGNLPLQHHRLSVHRGRDVRLRPLRDEIRLPDGNALEQIELLAGMTEATVWVREDFSVFARNFHLDPGPLKRTVLLRALGRVQDTPVAALPQVEPPPVETDASPAHALFHRHCAACHRSHDRAPPNFLKGDAGEVAKSLRQCAPRLYVRLSMGLLPEGARDKTPMPPMHAAYADRPGEMGLDAATVKAMLAMIPRWPGFEGDGPANLAALLRDGYENLPPCLPERGP